VTLKASGARCRASADDWGSPFCRYSLVTAGRAECEALRTALELAPVGAHAVSAGKTVLQDGHAVYILVEPVEKATDKRSAPLLCCRVADAGSSETISPPLARRSSPPPSVRLGLRLLRRKYPVPMLRAGTGLSQQDPIPRHGAPQRGPRSRADVLPRGTARSDDYAWPIRHSVDQKAAPNWNIAESVANRTLGLKVIRPGPRPIREGGICTHTS
jgi:hypothetical protein